MIRSYFLLAFRSLLKQKFFSLLNIAGLTISFLVAFFLLTYAKHELSFNSGFEKRNQIYRVNMLTSSAYNFEKWVQLPNAVGPAMLRELPEVEQMSRLVRYNFGGSTSLRFAENNFLVRDFYLTDAEFFTIFELEFTEGNAESVFKQPYSLAISEREKQRIFGDQSALGQRILLSPDQEFVIGGVFKDLPENSTFDGTVYGNIMDSWMGKDVYWSNASYETFCLLHSGADIKGVQERASALIDRYVEKQNQYFTAFLLQPLQDVYLRSVDLEHAYSSRSGNIHHVRLFFILSVLILGIAAINYINLTTARAQTSAKEVGVTKVLGAGPGQIRLRFYIETATVVLVSVLLVGLLSVFLLPLFNRLAESSFLVSDMLSWQTIFMLAGLWLLISLVSGSYPALLMSRMPALGLLSRWAGRSKISEWVRSGLVVFQFACSTVLIIGVITMHRQMRYVQNKDLGYQASSTLIVPTLGISDWASFQKTKQDIQDLAGTSSLVALQTYIGAGESGKNIQRPGAKGDGLPVRTNSSSGAVVPALGLHLIAGEDLPQNIDEGDTTSYLLINETVAGFLGYTDPNQAIGQRLQTEWAHQAEIRGVVRNFNYGSLKERVGGYLFYKMNRPPEGYNYFQIRYDTQNSAEYVEKVQQVYQSTVPESAFDYLFMDDYLQSLYRADNRSGQILTVFSLLAIFIACLGLFGLAAFTAEQRKKEIGVRKVLGAGMGSIVQLLSMQFSRFILLAIFIALPLAWWIFSDWLNGFVYRIPFSAGIVLLAVGIIIAIAALPIAFQSLKAARVRVVESLRNE